MSKLITRTIKVSEVKILNSVDKKEVKAYNVVGKISKKKVMKDYLKSINEEDMQPIIIEIREVEEKRGLPLEKFLELSEVIKDENESK